MKAKYCLLTILTLGHGLALSLLAQDAVPADRNPVNTQSRPGDMMADSPVTFPERGALPSLYPPDVKTETEPTEAGYYLFSSPCRSLEQIAAIQAAMPAGSFTDPAHDWRGLTRTREILSRGGDLQILALGDSIVNDTMRSGWVALLQQAYPQAHIQTTVYVRGGGGCQHYREEERVARNIVPRQPDLVLIGGISQKSIADIRVVIHQLREGVPDVEILLFTGTYGTVDPRQAQALAEARHSGTGDYGRKLQALAQAEHCAYLDMTGPWAEYIVSSGLHPHRFYRDVVHANAFGEQILARILMAYFQADSVTGVQNLAALWAQTEKNGDLMRRIFIHCRDFVRGWLAHADPATGLIPRNLRRDHYWNGRDSAADNYPFMVLTTSFTDRDMFHGRMRQMLRTERRLTSRVGPLPDDYAYATQAFRFDMVDMNRLIFGLTGPGPANCCLTDPVTASISACPWIIPV